MRAFRYCIPFGCAAFLLFAAAKGFASDNTRLSTGSPVVIKFTVDPPLFRDLYFVFKTPVSGRAVALDAVKDSAEIDRAQRLLREELAKYPPALLKQNLHEIYVFKDLLEGDTSFGGTQWVEGKRLYLHDSGAQDGFTDEYIRLTLHHEFAHLLFANHESALDMSRWQRLNPPSFHYGKGGTESIRAGTAGLPTLDPASWAQGFAYPYGKTEPEEDFACLCEAMFSGDTRFWQAVDRYPVLNKKAGMIVAFYHALDKTFSEAYFRHLPPLPPPAGANSQEKLASATAPVPVKHYSPGDVMRFPNGGQVILIGKSPMTITIPPGGSYVYPGSEAAVIFNPPGK